MTLTPTQARTEEPPPYTATGPALVPVESLETPDLLAQVANLETLHDCRDLLGVLRELSRPQRRRVEVALELARRIAEAEVLRESEPVRNSEHVHRFLSLKVAALEPEVFGAIFLDGRNRVIHVETLFRGTLASCHVHPREILRQVIHFAARGIVLYHNHPSGNPAPSRDDRDITQKIQTALHALGVRVLDPLILGDRRRYYSFADNGDIT